MTITRVLIGIYLGLAAVAQAATVQGKIIGSEITKGQDLVTGSFVIPSVRANSMLALQFDDFASPDEPMQVGGSTTKVPGNLYVPKQNVMYWIFPVAVSKENYTSVLNTGVTNELGALSFTGKASKIVSIIRNKEPFTKALPYINLKKMGFEPDRDWSTVTGDTNITLAHTPTPTINYSWVREPLPSNAQDLILAFQHTPANRWMLSDFASPGAPTGQIRTHSIFNDRVKAFFVRLYDSADPNVKEPASAVGYIREGASSGSITAPGLPPALNAAIAGTNQVTWDPIAKTGWMAISKSGSSRIYRYLSSFLHALAGEPAPLFELEAIQPATFIGWVDPAAGSYTFDSPIGTGGVTLLFLGTSHSVPLPSVGNDENVEPEIFTFADELRYQSVK